MTCSRELKQEIRLSESHTQTKILLVPWCTKHQGKKGTGRGGGQQLYAAYLRGHAAHRFGVKGEFPL